MDFPEEEKRKWIEWELKSKKYLYGKKLAREKYPIAEGHTHCEFCWGKFGEDAGDRKIGYHEKETNSWICEECYDIFKKYFYWKLI